MIVGGRKRPAAFDKTTLYFALEAAEETARAVQGSGVQFAGSGFASLISSDRSCRPRRRPPRWPKSSAARRKRGDRDGATGSGIRGFGKTAAPSRLVARRRAELVLEQNMERLQMLFSSDVLDPSEWRTLFRSQLHAGEWYLQFCRRVRVAAPDENITQQLIHRRCWRTILRFCRPRYGGGSDSRPDAAR